MRTQRLRKVNNLPKVESQGDYRLSDSRYSILVFSKENYLLNIMNLNVVFNTDNETTPNPPDLFQKSRLKEQENV